MMDSILVLLFEWGIPDIGHAPDLMEYLLFFGIAFSCIL
jgi:hypothetical protein